MALLSKNNPSEALADRRVTRGHGVVEPLLARLRCRMAKRLIGSREPGGRLLDLGCGSHPLFLTSAAPLFEECHGLDRVSDWIRSELVDQGLRVRNHDLDEDPHIPYEDGHFSVVTMLAVFEHLRKDRLPEVLREVHRVLEPGGRYVMTTPAAWSGPLLLAMGRLGLVSREEIDEHQDCYSHGRARALIEAAGFAPYRIRLGYFEFFMNNWAVAQKGLAEAQLVLSMACREEEPA